MVAALVASLALFRPVEALVFTKTAGFRHDSIPEAVAAMSTLDPARIRVRATEDSAEFTARNLGRYDVVVFLLTTGDVLDGRQQAAMEGFVEAGGGFVGVHSASDTEYDWPWYGSLVGAYFLSHPEIQPADVTVQQPPHSTMAGLPPVWRRVDEWYDFRAAPGAHCHVEARVDESTYQGGKMGRDHPVVWWSEAGKGRSWYTAMGHTKESYSEPEFVRMLERAVLWAAKRL
jgi:cytochrome c